VSTFNDAAVGGTPVARDQALFGQVMGYVAVTVGFTALGAYLDRDLSGGTGLLLFLAAFAVIVGLNVASARGREQLAIGLLFALGLLLGLAVAPVIADYADGDPAGLWQAAGATAAFVAGAGAYGYATRRDLSSWDRTLFWALLALIVFGLVAIFVAIPAANAIYALAGLVIFGGFTIVDFNRLRRADADSAVLVAASIFLDVFNVFLLCSASSAASATDNQKGLTMSTTQHDTTVLEPRPGNGTIPMRFEVTTLPVADVDRARAFYERLGWRLDIDFRPTPDSRAVQFTPPGSPASIQFGAGTTTNTEPLQRLLLIVDDIAAAHADLVDRGIEVSDIFHRSPEGIVAGVDPDRRSYNSFVAFADPDGNQWLLQEVTERIPGRV